MEHFNYEISDKLDEDIEDIELNSFDNEIDISNNKIHSTTKYEPVVLFKTTDKGFSMTSPNMIGATLSVPIWSSGNKWHSLKEAKTATL